jgi:hypothetical protein
MKRLFIFELLFFSSFLFSGENKLNKFKQQIINKKVFREDGNNFNQIADKFNPNQYGNGSSLSSDCIIENFSQFCKSNSSLGSNSEQNSPSILNKFKNSPNINNKLEIFLKKKDEISTNSNNQYSTNSNNQYTVSSDNEIPDDEEKHKINTFNIFHSINTFFEKFREKYNF